MSTPLDLFLVRHGVTDWNEQGRLLGRADVPLNERGVAQAAAVAEALRRFRVRAVLTSPQRRTFETAEAIARACDLQVETEPGLAEVWLGRWQSKTFDDLLGDPDLDHYLRDPDHRCDAIEAASAVRERVRGVVRRLRSAGDGGGVSLVSHGDPLRIILADLLGMELGAYRRFLVSPGSLSVVRLGKKRGQLVTLNWKPDGLGEIVPG